MNYFDLFGLPMAPSVDRSVLARKYFELQKKHHPDFYSQATEEEQETALGQSAAINKAFNIFQDPQKTIEYFLQEKGQIGADEKYSLPADFLMEMMEINEQMEEADPAATQMTTGELEKALFDEIQPVLEKHPDALSTEDLQHLKAYYYKKKYLKRILDRLVD